MQFKFPFIDVLTIPTGAGPGDARIVIDGVNGRIDLFDTISPLPRLSLITADGVNGLPDIQYDGHTYGRGFTGNSNSSTGNSGPFAPGVDVGMGTQPNLVNGRLYGVHFHSEVVFATGGFNAIECIYNGVTSIGQFYADTVTANSDAHMVDAWVIFFSSVTALNIDIKVRNNAASSGNISLVAGIDNPCRLSIYDLGA